MSDKDSLGLIAKVQSIKENIDTLDFIEVKNFSCERLLRKRQATDLHWEKLGKIFLQIVYLKKTSIQNI